MRSKCGNSGWLHETDRESEIAKLELSTAELNQNNVCINIATVQYLITLDASTLQQNAAFSRKQFVPVKIFSQKAIGPN